MPEGHTIHRLARDLGRSFRGETVEASSPQGRFEAGARRVNGQRCERFEAFGKHLFGHFDTGDVLHVHLGLIGTFAPSTGDPVGAVRLRLAGPAAQWDLRGPMVCDIGTPELVGGIAAGLGPDPLRTRRGRRADDDVADFAERLTRRRVAVGAALLDQKVIAGIGNVFRAELLFLAGIDPTRAANRLTLEDARQVWELAVENLMLGRRLNRIVTVDPDEVGARSAGALKDDERLYVYKRGGEPCRRCGSLIVELEIGGRKMWSCPSCQS